MTSAASGRTGKTNESGQGRIIEYFWLQLVSSSDSCDGEDYRNWVSILSQFGIGHTATHISSKPVLTCVYAFPIRHHFFQQSVEGRTVVVMLKMTKLMGDHVIDTLAGCLY